MRIARSQLIYIVIGFLGLLFLAGLTWGNYRFAQQSPGGNDFLPRWLGTRLYITEGQSPYSEETTAAIEDFYYGRAARGEEGRGFFFYPFYAMLVFIPFSLIEDYTLARAVWMTFAEISMVVIVFAGMRLANWRPKTWLVGSLFLFALIWYHGLRPLINGNPSIIVALFIILALWFIRAHFDLYAGIVIALTTTKPQMVVLFGPFVMLWAISKRRWRLVASTIISMLVLFGASFIMESDWLVKNFQQIVIYTSFSPPQSSFAIFSDWWGVRGNQAGWILTLFLSTLLFFEWRATWAKDFDWFFWTASLTLVCTNLIGIQTATANYVALVPALILVFSICDKRWGRAGRTMILTIMALFLIGLWALFIDTVEQGMGVQPLQHPILFLPLPVFLLLGLYWVRWWTIKRSRIGEMDLPRGSG